MQLHIRHETTYRYERLVKYSVQSLHLTPRRDAGQRTVEWRILAPGRRLEQVDAYGNVAHLLTLEDPHREIRLLVEGIVETAEHESRLNEGPLSPLAYLAPTALTAADDELRRFARDAVGHGDDPARRGWALAEAVRAAVRYRPGVSDVQDPATAALRSGEGVCQDHAHVFLAAARCLGLPARYVSGYFHPGGIDHVASHAWVDVWLGTDQGWQSIDVTHCCPAFGRYCRLAVGRDYLDAAPVRGVRRGGGAELLHTRVLVTESAQQQQ